MSPLRNLSICQRVMLPLRSSDARQGVERPVLRGGHRLVGLVLRGQAEQDHLLGQGCGVDFGHDDGLQARSGRGKTGPSARDDAIECAASSHFISSAPRRNRTAAESGGSRRAGPARCSKGSTGQASRGTRATR